MTPSKVSIFLSRGCSRVSTAIAYASSPIAYTLRRRLSEVPSHGGLKIDFTGRPLDSIAAEAHIDTDWDVVAWHSILDKRNAHTDRRLWIVELDFQQSELDEIWARSTRQVGLWDYNVRQLAALFIWRRVGRKPRKSAAEIDCTEGLSRILYPFLDCKSICGVDRHDTVTPFNLFEGLLSGGYSVEEIEYDPLYSVGSA